VNFISESVLVGFKCGIALFIASTQLPKLFGFKGSHGDFWERSGYFFSHWGETNMASLLLGLGALAVLLLGKRFLKNKPVSPVRGHRRHYRCFEDGPRQPRREAAGPRPQGLPPFGLPAVHVSDLNDLLPWRWVVSSRHGWKRPLWAACSQSNTGYVLTRTRNCSALPAQTSWRAWSRISR